MKMNSQADGSPLIVTEDEVQKARLKRDQAADILEDTQARLSEILHRQGALQKTLTISKWIRRARSLCDKTMTRVGVYIQLILVPSSLILIAGGLLDIPVSARVLAILVFSSF